MTTERKATLVKTTSAGTGADDAAAGETWVKHVISEGARYHVISWSNLGRHCSEPRCEINRPPRPSTDSPFSLKLPAPLRKTKG